MKKKFSQTWKVAEDTRDIAKMIQLLSIKLELKKLKQNKKLIKRETNK